MRLGVNEWTYHNWETNKTEPVISMFPRIIEFLGYYPFKEPQTVGEKLFAIRRRSGLSRARLAKMIGIDESTMLRIERNKPAPKGRCERRIRRFLASSTMPEPLL